jgi:hypothetical protein
MSLIFRSGRHAALLAGIVIMAGAFPLGGARASARGPATGQAANSFSVLQGVYCTSAASCWAVGFQGVAAHEVNRVLHWNGRTWHRVSAPSPAGSAADDESALAAVRCLTATNCWAVGDTYHNDITHNQALHWSGKHWSVVTTPNPGGSGPGLRSELTDVTCISSANCWAVGDYGNPSPSRLTLLNEVLHWNGERWSQVRVVNPGGTRTGHTSQLTAVRCGSARSCNAVGEYATSRSAATLNEVLHWNGTRWSQVHVPNPAGGSAGADNALSALACGAATNCWAAGEAATGTMPPKIRNEVLAWNGRRWSKAAVPNPNVNTVGVDNELRGATCSSTRNCWAVGQQRVVGSGGIRNEALRWNGKRWSLVSTPNPGGTAITQQNTLLGVRCTSASSCWAVGEISKGGPFQQEILFWNGGKWSVY